MATVVAERVRCIYSISLQINQILHAAEFVHPTRGFESRRSRRVPANRYVYLT